VFHRTAGLFRRGIRYLGENPVGSVDQSRVPAVWRHRPNNTASDTLICPCGCEGHTDLTASEPFLRRQTEQVLGRWRYPCGSSGTTTADWSQQTLPRGKVINNSAQTRVPSTATGMLPLASLRSTETPTEETPAFMPERISFTAASAAAHRSILYRQRQFPAKSPDGMVTAAPITD